MFSLFKSRIVPCRFFLRNDDVIMVCVQRWPWPMKLLFFTPPITFLMLLFWIFGYRGSWVEVAMYDSVLYGIKDRMNAMAIDFEQLYSAHEAEKSNIEANIEFIKKSKKSMKNYSDVIHMDRDVFERLEYRENPGDYWKKVSNLGGKKVTSIRERFHGKEEKDPQTAKRTAFVPKEMEGYRSLIEDTLSKSRGVEDTVFMDLAEKKNQQGDNSPYSNKKLKDKNETDAGHKARRKAISEGTFNPETWNYF